MKYIIIYIVAINILTFIIFYLDKKSAIKQKNRISETMLLKFAFAGGFIGGIYAMKKFRHKTIKKPFYIRMYIITAIYIILITCIVYKYYFKY